VTNFTFGGVTFTGVSGTGNVVASTSPAITTPSFTTYSTLANAASPTTAAVARVAFDTDAWAASRGAIQVHDGTANTYVVAPLASDTPSNGQVPTWNTGGTITWETPSGGTGLTTWPDIEAAQEMGSTLKTANAPIYSITTTNNMGDGTVYFIAVYLTAGQTITGATAFITTQGDYTADNNNKVGLYTYSAGTLTLVASCATDGNLWKASANTYIQKDFSSTYAASAGLHFVAFLYNSSAVNTAPALGRMASVTAAAANAPGTTNSGKLYGTLASQTDLPASQAMSGISASGTVLWAGVH
jgi:hypothetical protein